MPAHYEELSNPLCYEPLKEGESGVILRARAFVRCQHCNWTGYRSVKVVAPLYVKARHLRQKSDLINGKMAKKPCPFCLRRSVVYTCFTGGQM